MKRLPHTAHVGAYLAAKRNHFGIAQRDMSWALDISRGAVAYLESKQSKLSLERFCAYCAVIDLTPSDALAEIIALGLKDKAALKSRKRR